ncbi:condensation domain-containing protein [Streptomyces griseochromogenes]|uniref:condensation domain-containing protein n=1 Tax=Streptomyces griseochromogenes TaxID=68214 RepID=UPI00378E8682
MWLLEKLVPDTGINNVGLALQVSGRLRPDALKAAMAIMLGRHEVLRTVFRADGTADLVKETVPAGEFKVGIEPLDLSGGPLQERLTAFVDRPFRLDGRPLVRAGFATHPDGDVLCVGVHHLAFDMVSIAVFMREFIPVYEALATGRPIPAEAATRAPLVTGPEPQPADLAYWRETLSGLTPGGLDLWCGVPRGRQPVMTGENAGRTLSPEAQHAVLHLQRVARAPVAAVLLAAYSALLASHGAGPDIVIGSPVDVRGTNTSAIGYHVNVVPLRIRVDFTEGFRALARKARDAFLGAMGHAGVSVDDLNGELPGFGSSWQTALFRHMFNFLPDTSPGELSIDGMPARLLTIENPYSKSDLELVGTPSKADVWFRYSREILARADVEAMLRRFEALLIAAAQDADRPIGETAGWSDLDREVTDRANETASPAAPETVPAAFRSWATASPEAPAVVDGERTLTYQQAHRAALAIRDLLATEAGVRPGDVVAVAASPGEAAVAALGIWLAGAVHLPVDAGHDASWTARQLTHSGAKAVLTGTGVRLSADDQPLPVLSMDTARPAASAEPGPAGEPADPRSPACLFYASAPDGEPVATTLSHAGIANLVAHVATELSATPGTGTLTLAGLTSYESLVDLFLPLTSGGRLVVAPDEARGDGPALRDLIDRHDVGIVRIPAGTPARILQDAADRLPGLRVLVRGEEVSRATADRLLTAGCRLYGVHGAAETGGWALSARIDDPDDLTSGRPLTNTRAFITAPDGRELPIGLRGELCLAGTGLAPAGPDDARFSHNERYGRHYRTGELARRRSDGTIERLGHGSRQIVTADGPVDPSGIEAVLLDHPAVRAAVALAVTSPGEDRTVVAFAEVTDTAEPADGPLLRAHAREHLAPPAVPRQVVRLTALPRNADGRPDLDALARLAAKSLEAGPDEHDPAADDKLVQELVELWRQLLNTEVTAQTSFFEAGGHSLLAAVLAQKIEELTGVSLELSEVFEHPTPAALAARVRA